MRREWGQIKGSYLAQAKLELKKVLINNTTGKRNVKITESQRIIQMTK